MTETEVPIGDANFYIHSNVKLVRVQRWFGPQKLAFIKNFLKPLSERVGFSICYEIDDVLVYDKIPAYNMAKEAFNPKSIGNSTQEIMSLCDIITVSTEELRDLYVHDYKLPREKFIVIPNYLPRWWIGEAMNVDRQMYQFKHHRAKPNIAFCCSANHFDVHNANKGIDDFTALIPWIQRNLKKYNFIFVGRSSTAINGKCKA